MDMCDFVTEINMRFWYNDLNKIHKNMKLQL